MFGQTKPDKKRPFRVMANELMGSFSSKEDFYVYMKEQLVSFFSIITIIINIAILHATILNGHCTFPEAGS